MSRRARRISPLFASSLAGLTALALITALSPAACTLSRSGISGNQGGGGNGGAGNSSQGGSSQGGNGQGGTTSTMVSSGGMGGDGGNTTGGAGGCTPTAEDCLNGLDDDCDGMADCEDTDCTGNNYECVPLPQGGTLVDPVDQPGDCDGELTVATLADCSQCGCSVDDTGSCTHIAYLYEESNCNGTPVETIQIMAGNTCTPANTSAINGQTVSARSERLGLNDASCSPDTASAPTTNRFLCTLPSPGSCAGNDVCVPTDAVPCVMFNGDVSCPAGFDEKELIYDTTANNCNCDCTVVDQTCPTGEHYHAFDNAICDGGGGSKVDVQATGVCTTSPYAAFGSLDNHTANITADDATCEPTGDQSMAQDARTLCCPPD